MILDDGGDDVIPGLNMLDYQFDVSQGCRDSEDEGRCSDILGYSAEDFEREVGEEVQDWEGSGQYEDTEPTLVDNDDYLELAVW